MECFLPSWDTVLPVKNVSPTLLQLPQNTPCWQLFTFTDPHTGTSFLSIQFSDPQQPLRVSETTSTQMRKCITELKRLLPEWSDPSFPALGSVFRIHGGNTKIFYFKAFSPSNCACIVDISPDDTSQSPLSST